MCKNVVGFETLKNSVFEVQKRLETLKIDITLKWSLKRYYILCKMS